MHSSLGMQTWTFSSYSEQKLDYGKLGMKKGHTSNEKEMKQKKEGYNFIHGNWQREKAHLLVPPQR